MHMHMNMHLMSIDAKRDHGFEREQVGVLKKGLEVEKKRRGKEQIGCAEIYVAEARLYLKTSHARFQSGISHCSHTVISAAIPIFA